MVGLAWSGTFHTAWQRSRLPSDAEAVENRHVVGHLRSVTYRNSGMTGAGVT